MYTLTHNGEEVGTTNLERGDPSIQEVSGEFINVGGPKALAGWIKSVGGEEDDGVVYIALSKDFTLTDKAGKAVDFKEGTLISVPNENEVYLNVGGLSDEDYKTYFAEHMSAEESVSE